ncbi:hypothetical protein [Dactylosporangium matsuzakiense]|uniref:Uncharacterized protein n=1 Tax=Dactylosporangium matsuzakiense TaxID=53360 RepID=A0A9W6KMQ8_9ACTN|nr:hypothetical protein [Dactylosporangium matsuzakiense]GLL03735.1 hypothetical protein GCM10017581_054810 [Dactylosporangium matsuzakiense]
MLYALPATPPVTLIGPDDATWWAARGEDPAGRSALVIGGLHDADALVIAAPLPALAAYLPALHTALQHAVQPGPWHDLTAPPPPGGTLVTLPHTGIRVPDPALHVSAYEEFPMPEPLAYTATLQWGPTPAGNVQHNSCTGAIMYWSAPGTPVNHEQLDAFAAASRTAAGTPLTTDDLIEALISEHQDAAHVAAAVRDGRSPIRLRVPFAYGAGLDSLYYTAERRTAATVTTPAALATLTRDLQRLEVPDGAWWQLWTGQGWEDFTTPPPSCPGLQDPR